MGAQPSPPSPFPFFFFFFSDFFFIIVQFLLFLTVGRHVRLVRQVSPKRRGRGDVLGADCAVGQQEQQEDSGAEDPAVSSGTYGTTTPTAGSRLVDGSRHNGQ